MGPHWVVGHHRIFTFSVGKSGENLKKEVKKSEKFAENSIGPHCLNLHSRHQMETSRGSSEVKCPNSQGQRTRLSLSKSGN